MKIETHLKQPFVIPENILLEHTPLHITLIEHSVLLKNNFAGHLVVDYISANDGTMEDYISGLSANVDSYNGYNLLMGDFRSVALFLLERERERESYLCWRI